MISRPKDDKGLLGTKQMIKGSVAVHAIFKFLYLVYTTASPLSILEKTDKMVVRAQFSCGILDLNLQHKKEEKEITIYEFMMHNFIQ